jgi:hypothetical protein
MLSKSKINSYAIIPTAKAVQLEVAQPQPDSHGEAPGGPGPGVPGAARLPFRFPVRFDDCSGCAVQVLYHRGGGTLNVYDSGAMIGSDRMPASKRPDGPATATPAG